MSLIPDERPVPYEVPWRQIEHQETDEFPEDWGFRSYPVGHAKTDVNWPKPDPDDVARFRDELAARDRRRALLGGFGFGAAG